ncbi:AI-2E family transporter [Halostagnicola kamekurae]|uniref:Predicted PurR-regulated permease PerM n=1 Tax=Halostagnicola kamekurae TaxID=619731 RepID=A0A1I6TEZ0_9EURY|nr:AI-2E family transporter [Halostagnicola kamekurae]SFS87770.1 Predicted PurR-regulated permease PerM [Halostagnicola kamekurae]
MVRNDSRVRNSYDWSTRQRRGWWILGLALLAVVGLVVNRYLPWLVFGLFVYYVARPITRRLERRIDSPTLVAALTLLVIIVPIIGVVGVLLLVALGQLVTAIADLPIDRIVSQLPVQVSDLPNTPTEVYDTTVVLIQQPSVQNLLGTVGGILGGIGAVLFNAFVSLLIAFFLLISDRDIAAWFESNVFGEGSAAAAYLSKIDRGLSSVYFGYTMTIFVVILLTTLLYTGFNLLAPADMAIPSAVLFAVVTGLFTLVPLVGRSVVYFTIAAILAVQAIAVDPRLLWFPLAFLVVMIVAFDTLVRTYIRPYLSGRLLDTGLVMFAYLFGPPLFGWSGVFLGPFLMLFIVTFIRTILPALVGPERDRVDGDRNHTLDEFSENVGERGENRATETDGSDFGTDDGTTA